MQPEDSPAREVGEGGDMLDAVVDLDEQWFEEGYEAGQEEARRRSIVEGKATGRAKGFEIGAELGFYEACCRVWLSKVHSPADSSSDQVRMERVEKAVAAVLEAISNFPRKNLPDVDYVDSLQRIRARFKAAMTLLGVRLPFSLKAPSDEGLSF